MGKWACCGSVVTAPTVSAARARLFVPRAAVEIRARVGGGVVRKGAAALHAGFFSGCCVRNARLIPTSGSSPPQRWPTF